MTKNGKRNAAQIAAKNAVLPPSVTKKVDVDNPYIKDSRGTDINVFDVYDGRPRLMFIMEENPMEQIDPAMRISMHTIRWNCDEFIAHSIAVDGCAGTRTLELEALREKTREVIAMQNGSEDSE